VVVLRDLWSEFCAFGSERIISSTRAESGQGIITLVRWAESVPRERVSRYTGRVLESACWRAVAGFKGESSQLRKGARRRRMGCADERASDELVAFVG